MYVISSDKGPLLSCSHFELVILASQRAYDIKSGAVPRIEYKESDKNTVIALRELMQDKLDHQELYKLALKRMQAFSGTGFSGAPSESPSTSKNYSNSEELDNTETEKQDFSFGKEMDDDVSFADDEEE